MFLIERTVTVNGKTTYQAMLYVTSLTAEQADPADLLAYVRQHWGVEVLHWIRDVTFREDASQIRTGNAPRVMATLRNAVVSLLRITTPPTSPPHYATTPARTAGCSNSWDSASLNTEPADFAVPVPAAGPRAYVCAVHRKATFSCLISGSRLGRCGGPHAG